MPIRNPFARRPGPGPVVNDENARPNGSDTLKPAHPGFEKQDTVGSMASSSLSIRSSRSQDTGEYKMSVVNDSGVYLPPSPTEEKGLWPKKYLSSGRNSTDTRNESVGGEIEHFSISRESFDSYRRSFDISARSPVISHDLPPRQSLDSARFPRLPRSAFDRKTENEHPTVEESGFEDVGLNDEHAKQPRRRGLFARFGDSNHESRDQSPTTTTPTNNAVSRFLKPGRKRGQSGQGSELGNMNVDHPIIREPDGQELH